METVSLLAATSVVVEVEWLSMLIGTVIPLIVGLVTKMSASSGVKAVVNALLSAISGFLVTVIEAGGSFELETAVVTILLTWATSVATYYGLLKPTETARVVQLKTRRFGVGGSGTQRHAA